MSRQLKTLLPFLVIAVLSLSTANASSHGSCTLYNNSTKKLETYQLVCCKKSRLLFIDSVDWHLYSCPSDTTPYSECDEHDDVVAVQTILHTNPSLVKLCEYGYTLSGG